jgi:hypothetical protein
MSKIVKCPRCGYEGEPKRKMWCYLCAKCSIVIDGTSVLGPMPKPEGDK